MGLRHTALYQCHIDSEGKMIDFAGYALPVQYPSGILKEHMAVRSKVGLFDVSHMGEIIFTGEDALNNLQRLLTNDFAKMAPGRIKYSLMCYENGGVVDDLLVYKISKEKYLVVVNAANRQKDFHWMKTHLSGNVTVEDASDKISQLALQGPYSTEIITKITDSQYIPQKYYTFIEHADIQHMPCLISRTGYTGEKGYEIYIDNRFAQKLWNLLLEVGKPFGLIPCGLGTRDTLRLEAGMPLYGHEMDENITPFEAGLNFAVKMAKPHFIGKAALLEKRNPARARIGLKVLGRGIVREKCPITVDGRIIGRTTSGTYCPYLRYSAAMALVDKNDITAGRKVFVKVRNHEVEAEMITLPFYNLNKKSSS
ncbi:MAG: glycine cleavage system aminomethyltransferase GcvT [Sporolactobacillus sp.]|jgi:aminomethyltransferase|nr:glycine cleavage system aminomethyltransferase GcvT [Sporolactobacillus sp.]